MFERIRALFAGGGLFTGTLQSPANHPQIGVDAGEYQRVLHNMQVYGGQFAPVPYQTAGGQNRLREFVPLNVVKFAANRMATLLFNEKCRVNMEDEEAAEFVNRLFLQSNFAQNLGKYLEVAYAAGGIAIRPYYSGSAGRIKLSWCLPDRFFPLHSTSGEVTGAAFVTKTRRAKGQRVLYYSLFEIHGWQAGTYEVRNELYVSEEANRVGRQTHFAALDTYADLPESTKIEGLSRPLFVYIKPAQMNNLAPDSPLGVGMCDNARHTINLLHDKFYANIRRSISGLAVAPEYLHTRQENGRTFATMGEDNLFLPLPSGLDDAPLREISVPIQAGQFIEAINFELRTFEAQVGFSSGTFAFEERGGLKPATQVVAEDSLTYQTRNREVVALEQSLRDLAHTALELGAATGLYTGDVHPEITVDFDDGVFQNRGSQLDYYGKAASLGLMPRTDAICRAFNLPRPQAEEWAKRIAQEQAEAKT